MQNLYIVTECGEEGHSWDHGIFTDPKVAQDVADKVDLQRFSSIQVKTMKLDGVKFVRAEPGDEGYVNSVRERD